MTLVKYRKKPEIVEAENLETGQTVRTDKEYIVADAGDWVTYDSHGYTKVYKPSEFNESFEPIEKKIADVLDDLAKLTTQKNNAYAERNELVAFLSHLYPSHLTRHPDSDKEWDDEWRYIVCVHSPAGQLTWHIHDTEKMKFGHLYLEENDWDGHSNEEKYARLRSIHAEEK